MRHYVVMQASTEMSLTRVRQNVFFEGRSTGELFGAVDAQENGKSRSRFILARLLARWIAVLLFIQVLFAFSLVFLHMHLHLKKHLMGFSKSSIENVYL